MKELGFTHIGLVDQPSIEVLRAEEHPWVHESPGPPLGLDQSFQVRLRERIL